MWALVWSVVGNLLVSGLLVPVTSEGAPNPVPRMTIELTPETCIAPTIPYCATEVRVFGNVTVDKYCGTERITVTLAAFVEDGFRVDVHPRTVPFINPRTERFLVTVTVQPGAPPGGRELMMRATSKVSGLAPSVAESTCVIQVRSHSRADLEVIEPLCLMRGMDTVEVGVRVWNKGTHEDDGEIDRNG